MVLFIWHETLQMLYNYLLSARLSFLLYAIQCAVVKGRWFKIIAIPLTAPSNLPQINAKKYHPRPRWTTLPPFCCVFLWPLIKDDAERCLWAIHHAVAAVWQGTLEAVTWHDYGHDLITLFYCAACAGIIKTFPEKHVIQCLTELGGIAGWEC